MQPDTTHLVLVELPAGAKLEEGGDESIGRLSDRVRKLLAVASSEGLIVPSSLLQSSRAEPLSGADYPCGSPTHFDSFRFAADRTKVGDLVNRLIRVGVGHGGSSFAVVPLDVYRCEDASPTGLERKRRESVSKAKSMPDHLMVEKYIRRVEAQAEFTFDYACFILIASVLAGVGLATDNSVILVAAMLVSPFMGPVLGVTLGASLGHRELVRTGAWTGLKALGLSILSGMVMGAIAVWHAGGVEPSWPTDEMFTRGDIRALPLGLVIALASGAGVALSGLSENTGALVGVALSASLLPPATNAGMCWSCECDPACMISYDLPSRLPRLRFLDQMR